MPRNGTSFAAPAVAGVVARLLQLYPSMTVPEIWAHLRDNATPVTADLDKSPYTENHRLIYASQYE
ncbi:MAG: S8 family serine peptidase [Thermoanaerobaculia bacterium]